MSSRFTWGDVQEALLALKTEPISRPHEATSIHDHDSSDALSSHESTRLKRLQMIRDQSLSSEASEPHHASEILSDDDLQTPASTLQPSTDSPSVQWRANASRWREKRERDGSEGAEVDERHWDMERGVWVDESQLSTAHTDISAPPVLPRNAQEVRRRGALKRTAWDDLQALILARHAAYRAAKASIEAQRTEDQDKEPFGDELNEEARRSIKDKQR